MKHTLIFILGAAIGYAAHQPTNKVETVVVPATTLEYHPQNRPAQETKSETIVI